MSCPTCSSFFSLMFSFFIHSLMFFGGAYCYRPSRELFLAAADVVSAGDKDLTPNFWQYAVIEQAAADLKLIRVAYTKIFLAVCSPREEIARRTHKGPVRTLTRR